MIGWFSGWERQDFSCKTCGWSGKGSDAAKGELERYCLEMKCPQCGEEIFALRYPSDAEKRANWDKLSDSEKKSQEEREMWLAEVEARKLKSADQLPDLAGEKLMFLWDFDDKTTETVIRLMDVTKDAYIVNLGQTVRQSSNILVEEVWREKACYGGKDRFDEMAALLREKYKDRYAGLVASEASSLYLYGD